MNSNDAPSNEQRPPTLVEIVNSPELTDIVASAPDTKQEEIALQLLSVARRLTGTDCLDAFETQDRLEQIKGDLPRVLKELTCLARTFVNAARTECDGKGSVRSIQTAWGIVPPSKPERRGSGTALDAPDALDRIALLRFIQDMLPRDTQAQRRIYSQVLREASNDWPEMSDTDIKTESQRRVTELVKEHRRLSYTKEESWFFGRKAKNELPTREEFLKRIPLARNRLRCVERSDGQVFYSLSDIDPKCSAVLAVPIADESVINRLEKRYIILKSSRSKGTKWRLSFHYRWHGRTSRLDTEVPLETVIPKYKIIDGDTVTEFTAVDLEQKEAARVGKSIRNPLQMGDTGTEWMGHQPPANENGSAAFESAPAESPVGIARGTKRSAQAWRAGRKHGSDDGDFAQALTASMERQGATLHPDDDRRSGRLEIDEVRINIGPRPDDGEGDGMETGRITRLLDAEYEKEEKS